MRLKADRKRVFAKLSQESREEREKRLKVLRDNNASEGEPWKQPSKGKSALELNGNRQL